MPKEGYVDEYLKEMVGYDEDIDDDEENAEDLGDGVSVTDKTGTIVVENNKRFAVRAVVFRRVPGELNKGKKWKRFKGRIVRATSKALFTVPAGRYRVVVQRTMRARKFKIRSGAEKTIQIGR